MSKNRIPLISALALCALWTAPVAAYLLDSSGASVKSQAGQCWQAAGAQAGAECSDTKVAAAPAAVATSAPAAAAAKPAPPKRCDASTILAADELFESSNATLKPSGKEKLQREVLGKVANCAKVDFVLVSGHTDRLAAADAAQALTDKQAEAVKAQLAAAGLGSEIDTMGMGKTTPAKFCPDQDDRKALSECLAANRRVVVEIKGLAK